MITVTMIFVLAAVISIIVHVMGKCPLWVPVLCLCVAVALMIFPK